MRLATWMPFAQAARVLRDFTHVAVSEATVRRLTEAAGAEVVAAQTAEVARIEQELPAAPVGPARAVVEVDGAMVPLRGGEWAEVRTLAIGDQPPPGPAQPTSRTTDLSYFSRLTDAANFERLSLVETQRRGLEQAGAIAGVADGAEWVQSFLDTHCPQALRILDFAHAVEHLSVIGSAVWGEGSTAAQTWVAAQARWLKRVGPAWLLDEVRDLLAGQPQSEVLRRELAYLEKRAAQMDYPRFRAAGWPVGSGIIESGNKLVVEARLKGAGMRWARAHVNPLLGLRNAVCNDRWAEAWASSAERGRAQRQARRQAGHQARAARRAAQGAPTPVRAEEAGAAEERGGCVNPEVVAQVEEVLRRPAYARAGSAPQDGREAWRPAANHPWKRPLRPKARHASVTSQVHAKP